MEVYRRHKDSCPEKVNGRKSKGACACQWWVDARAEGYKLASLGVSGERKDAEKLGMLYASTGRIPGKATRAEVKPSVAEYVDRFLNDRQRDGVKERTLQHYGIILGAFATRVEFLDQITKAEIEGFLDSRKGKAGKPTLQTRRSEVDVLRSFCLYCVGHEAMKRNFAGEIKVKIVDRKCTPPFSDAEMNRILKIARDSITGQTLYALILLMVSTGLRIGDAVNLRRDEVVDGRIRRRMQKTGRIVNIPLTEFPLVLEALETLQSSDPEYLFYDGHSPILSVNDHWRQLMIEVFTLAKVKGWAKPHRLRDTFAIGRILAGVPIHVVSLLLGHRNVTITQRYYADYIIDMEPLLESAMAARIPTEPKRSRLALVSAR
jgi:integrase/recombinase XerD